MKTVWWVIIILLVGLAIWRFWTPEDNWICQNGQWVKHGNPSTPMPTIMCVVSTR